MKRNGCLSARPALRCCFPALLATPALAVATAGTQFFPNLLAMLKPRPAHTRSSRLSFVLLSLLFLAATGHAARKLRAVLTAFAIVLGVAMVSGTFDLTDTIDKAYSNLIGETYA